MHPAPSVILFTVLSGMGFGLLAMLGLGVGAPTGLGALAAWGLGFALAVAGLLASTFHLGNPQRALLAFTQWRTSWLSREGWFSVAALLALAPVALAAVGGGGLRWLGLLGAVLCLLTILATAMIYAQLRTVPRWNHWTTPALFFAFALSGGAILAPAKWLAVFMLIILGALLLWSWKSGDARFAARGHTLATATGLASAGGVRSFAPPHTGPNYLTREMIHVVGRRHAARLRVIAFTLAAVMPAAILAVAPEGLAAALPAALLHLAGALAARWLFFAEAEHVVGLYYGVHDGR
ncbi:MAG: dimethyl sulfoxide reductase anchor subunit family protein [Paracoccaceae bacterium]